MLLELARWLAESHIRAFGVFEYITLRAVLACATSLVIGLWCGPWVIRRLTEMKIGQAVRSYGPESHLQKNGTPTMGGGAGTDFNRGQYFIVGRLDKPLCMGGIAGDFWFWLDWLGRRL